MPNCDFYALAGDLIEVLDFVFAQPGWTLIELASQHEQKLREFHATGDLVSAFPQLGKRDQHFQLYSPEMGAKWTARRIDFNPGVGAKFRYDCEGWGLIQLYLGSLKKGALSSSHTNHNSQTRARNWEPVARKLGKTNAWDFRAVTRMSSRLNRFIRSRGTAKHGSRPILAKANEALVAGKLKLS